MLTAIVFTRGEPMSLAETLSSLVPAVAEGLMSHAVVVAEGESPDISRIADAMGATSLTASENVWREGARAARGEWVLLLEAGETPEPGWVGAVEGHLMRQSSASRGPAFLPLSGGLPGVLEFVALALGARLLGPGLVAPRLDVAAGKIARRPRRLAAGRRRTPR